MWILHVRFVSVSLEINKQKHKLDGVGPVDNWPSTHQLHHFLRFFKDEIICHKKMWQVTRDTWHVTHDTWHETDDTWHKVWDENSLKMSAPLLFLFGIGSVWKIFELKDEWISESVIIEQPLLHRVC